MKKCLSFLVFILLVFNFFIIIPQNSFATNDNFDFSRFDNTDYTNKKANKMTNNIMGTALKIIRTVATGIAVLMLTYIAIKYMLAAPSERADLKKSAMIYIVGAILVLGTQQLLAVIQKAVVGE